MAHDMTHDSAHAGHDAHHHDHHHGGIRHWLQTTNHKDIGTLYFIFAMISGVIGGALSIGIRLELAEPGLQYFGNPHLYNVFVTGHTAEAIGLAIWGALAVGLVDNFIGPRLVGSSTKLHPVLVLLAILGGLKFFGIIGFLIGPIIMAVFVAMIEMYREEFKDYIASK